MLNNEIFKKLSELSQIKFSEDEKEKMLKQLKEAILIIDKIKDFQLCDNASSENRVLYKDLRNDLPSDSCKAKEIVETSEKTNANAFSIPKIIWRERKHLWNSQK